MNEKDKYKENNNIKEKYKESIDFSEKEKEKEKIANNIFEKYVSNEDGEMSIYNTDNINIEELSLGNYKSFRHLEH